MAQVPPIDPDERETEPRNEQSSSWSKREARRYTSEEVLPSVSSDERDIGWGDQPSEYGDDWYTSERPPHHG